MASQIAPNAQAAAADDKNPKEEFTYHIIISDDGYTFDLKLEAKSDKNKPKKIREKLRQAGGTWNKERHAYTFLISDMGAVKKILGDDSINPVMDPTKTLVVSFTIRFQCSDTAAAQDVLKKIGLQQDRSGHWQGTLDHLDSFKRAFN